MCDAVRKYFVFNGDTNSNKCMVERCIKSIKGDLKNNLKRHIITNHKDIAKNENWLTESTDADDCSPLQKKIKIDKKIKVSLDAEKVRRGCLEMVTIHSLPFKAMDYDGFRRILNPITDTLGINISSNSIKNDVLRCAEQMKNVIVCKTKGKMLCLKMDSATRQNRNILGINVQYINDINKIEIQTLAMLVIEKRQTSQNLKDEVIKVLNSYNIELWQIYAVTVDNGANMIKAVELLKKEIKELLKQNDTNQPFLNSSNNEIVHENGENDESIYTTDDENLNDDVLVGVLNAVRCSAHTLQLAANDAIKNENIKPLIDEIRSAIKNMRSVTHKEYFLCNPNKKPIMDVVTRWGSTYEMLHSLQTVKDFYKLFFENNSSIKFNDNNWDFIDKFCAAFQPVYIATKELQEAELAVGDFYKSWLKCKILLTNLSSNTYAQTIKIAMDEREKKLFENESFIAGLFMDPRFNFLASSHLSIDAKEKAKVCYLNSLSSLAFFIKIMLFNFY